MKKPRSKKAAAEVGSSAVCLRASPKNPPSGDPRGLATNKLCLSPLGPHILRGSTPTSRLQKRKRDIEEKRIQLDQHMFEEKMAAEERAEESRQKAEERAEAAIEQAQKTTEMLLMAVTQLASQHAKPQQ